LCKQIYQKAEIMQKNRDPVGEHFNLTEQSFVHVVRCLKESGLKRILLLGGGGYHHANTARAWAAATNAALEDDTELPNEVPEETPRFAEFGPDFVLPIRASGIKDENVI
jgi:acetoin utilization deacetylase AcuC-like enzyme